MNSKKIKNDTKKLVKMYKNSANTMSDNDLLSLSMRYRSGE